MDNREQKIEAAKVLNEFLEALIEDIKDIVEMFRDDNVEKALTYMPNIAGALKDVFDATEEIKDILRDNFNKDEYLNLVSELVESLENNDYVLLADLLEYEIVPMLINLKDINLD